jgi:hypothetical protein
MSDYVAPGVYVSEGGSTPPPIRGVCTTTAAFIGIALSGPAEPTLLNSFAEYQDAYGTCLESGFLGYAVRGFFQNGGTRCYVLRTTPGAKFSDALRQLNDLEISVVASPDAQALPGIQSALIAHCEELRYRFAVLDAPQTLAPTDGPPAQLKSSYAAYYYPWLIVEATGGSGSVSIPACGHIAGVYALSDDQRGVWHAPAGMPITGISGLDQAVTDAQQAALSLAGVNVLRSFPGRGSLVWGARTTSNDPEWKYVNVRRLFIYLEQSIETGTQWVIFEPNGVQLWEQVRRSVNDFLFNEWKIGALQGSKPEQAFYVRCDRTTMTQDDIDNGRLVIEIGVAPLRPAEFVIFRIGQWTADAKPNGC